MNKTALSIFSFILFSFSLQAQLSWALGKTSWALGQTRSSIINTLANYEGTDVVEVVYDNTDSMYIYCAAFMYDYHTTGEVYLYFEGEKTCQKAILFLAPFAATIAKTNLSEELEKVEDNIWIGQGHRVIYNKENTAFLYEKYEVRDE